MARETKHIFTDMVASQVVHSVYQVCGSHLYFWAISLATCSIFDVH